MRRRRTRLIAAISLAAMLTACGGGGGSADGGDAGGYPIDATLIDYSISPGRTSVPGGLLLFTVSNRSQDSNHEFVLIKTNLAPDKLPTKPDGSVDEAGAGIEILGEIESLAPGDSMEKSFDLTPGKYVMICNLVDTTAAPAKVHYQLGMRTPLTVT